MSNSFEQIIASFNMNKSLTVLIVVLIFTGCKSYKNADKYTVGIGETVEIYYSTNSCCYYCFSNEQDLTYSKITDKKMIDPGPTDCEGCTYTGAFIFKAESIGTDTIKLKHLTATDSCVNNNAAAEIYVIEVK